MKQPSVDYPEKCPLYQSIQSIFSPSASRDAGQPPMASAASGPSFALAAPDMELSVYRSARELPECWDELLPEGQRMMGRAYLCAQEEAPAEGMGYAYLIFRKGRQAVGLANCQLMEFRALQQIQSLQENAGGHVFRQLWRLAKRAFASRINYNLIICGATQFTGQHAFVFDPSLVSPALGMQLLNEGLERLAGALQAEGWRASAILIKDLEKGPQPFLQHLRGYGYAAFPFQPNMVLPLPAGWSSFEDYLEAMVSKYRVRARRAFKKGQELTVRELDVEGLRCHEEEIYRLYNAIAGRADFNMLSLTKGYFLALKQAMPGHFRVFGYYRQDELLGFCSTLGNGPEMEAHFMGFRPEENLKYQLYLNMLYDMIRIGIEEEQAEKIVFSRTALEIKSSVGAEPVEMYCCLRHLNPAVNRVLPALVRWLEPVEEWQQRHPFGGE